MTSENYRQLLNNEYNVKELNQEEFDDTLMHFAMLYHKEQLALYDVSQQCELLSCETCKFNCDDWNDDHPCANCAGFEFWEAT